MRRLISRISAAAYAVVVVGALTFGASEALGRTVQSTCPYDGYTWLGACINMDEQECTERCQAISGDSESVGSCHMGAWYGCCVCMMR